MDFLSKRFSVILSREGLCALITAVRYDVKPHSPSDTNLKRTIPGVRGKSAELPLISSRAFLITQRTVFYSSRYTTATPGVQQTFVHTLNTSADAYH